MSDFVVNSKLYTPEICLIDEEELERDREYLMQMYPARARMIMVLVEDECDRLEYEGSPMFAMFPDKETLRRIADKIYNKVKYKDDIQLEKLKNKEEIAIYFSYFLVNKLNNLGLDAVSREVDEPKLPVVYGCLGERTINMMNGYTQVMSTSLMRDGIIPIDEDYSVRVRVIDESGFGDSYSYELRSISGDNLIEN